MRPAPIIEPTITLVEMCWQMRSLQKTTRILACGIYRTGSGLEVRTGYGPEDLLYSMHCMDVARGRKIAEQLRLTVIDKGGFEPLAST